MSSKYCKCHPNTANVIQTLTPEPTRKGKTSEHLHTGHSLHLVHFPHDIAEDTHCILCLVSCTLSARTPRNYVQSAFLQRRHSSPQAAALTPHTACSFVNIHLCRIKGSTTPDCNYAHYSTPGILTRRRSAGGPWTEQLSLHLRPSLGISGQGGC